jgi:hypothetical protein
MAADGPYHDEPCGIYTLGTVELAMDAMRYGYSTACFIGLVDVWGRVARYEDGYRSEYAMVRSILVRAVDYVLPELFVPQAISDLSQIYDCTVGTFERRWSPKVVDYTLHVLAGEESTYSPANKED